MKYDNPLEWQKAFIRDQGYDALVSSSPDNLAYTIGYVMPSLQLGVRKRRFAAVVTPDGPDVLLVVTPEFKQAKSDSRIRDVREYNEFTESPMGLLADILREIGADRGRVGIEMDFMPARDYLRLREQLPKTDFQDAEPVFDRLRMLKTQEEIDRLKRIGSIVHRAHIEACRQASPGWTEMQFGNAIRDSVRAQGGEGLNNLVVASGYRSTWSNCPPSHKVLELGEVIKVDVFAHDNGYQSDIARTVAVGRPTAFQKDIWARLVDIHSAMLTEVRPGASTRALWQLFVDEFASHDLTPSIRFAGHGLGLTLHEEPYISSYADSILEEGMVLAIEPVTHVEGTGFHIEDEVIVTADGCELISDGRGEMLTIK